MRWFFDQVKESSFFFKSDLTDPHQIFEAHFLETTDLSPSSFHFSVGFISRSYFESDGFIAYSNDFFRISDKSAFFFSAQRACERVKPIGRVSVKFKLSGSLLPFCDR